LGKLNAADSATAKVPQPQQAIAVVRMTDDAWAL